MKKVLATAVLAAFIGFSSGCDNNKKKVDAAPPTVPLDATPPTQAYVPQSVTALPPNTNTGVSPAPMGVGGPEATPVTTGTKTTKTHPPHGKTSTASNAKITGTTYTIKAGDTLQKISLAKYGTTKRWKAILKANPQIKNPDKLIVGQKIKLP